MVGFLATSSPKTCINLHNLRIEFNTSSALNGAHVCPFKMRFCSDLRPPDHPLAGQCGVQQAFVPYSTRAAKFGYQLLMQRGHRFTQNLLKALHLASSIKRAGYMDGAMPKLKTANRQLEQFAAAHGVRPLRNAQRVLIAFRVRLFAPLSPQ